MIDARQFLQAAEQRFSTAEFLLDSGRTLDAFYLGGYSIECVLKALILDATEESERESVFERISSGAQMHYHESLAPFLKERGKPVPLELVRGLRRFVWHTSLRYESGRRPRSEVRGFLKVAVNVINWARGEMG
jgi:HEPN domain-containing protein